MAAHRYWRLLITANNGDTAFTVVGELGLLDADYLPLTGLGTASASTTQGSQTAALGFDGDPNTYWESLINEPPPHWLAYDFGTGNAEEVAVATITADRDDERMPKDFEVQFSDDGLAWTTDTSFTGETEWDADNNELRGYGLAAAPPGDTRVSKAVAQVSTQFFAQAQVAKVFAQVTAQHASKARASKLTAQVAGAYPVLNYLAATLQETLRDGTYDYTNLTADTLQVHRLGAVHKGRALYVRARPRIGESYPTARFRALLYAAKSDGTPGALLQLSNEATGLVDGGFLDLVFPGQPKIGFGNYYVGIWSDSNVQLRGESVSLAEEQSTVFGGDPGTVFSGAPPASSDAPYLELFISQTAQTRQVGGPSGQQAADEALLAADTMRLGLFYNLQQTTYEAAAFETRESSANGQYRVVVYSEAGVLMAESQTCTGAVSAGPNVTTFASPLPLSAGLYYVGVVSDIGWDVALVPGGTDGTAPQEVAATFGSPPSDLTGATSATDAPVVSLLQQASLPIVPALKSPLLQVWAGI